MFGDRPVDGQDGAIGRRRRPHEGVAHRAADDHLDQIAGRGLDRVHRGDPPTVAKNGDAVGDPEDFVEAMGDIDDADAAVAQAAQRLQQPLDVGAGKRRGWLVEHKDIGLDRKRPADRHQRPLGGGQGGDRHVGVEVAAHDAQRVGGGATGGAPRNQAEPRARIAGHQRDILGDGHPFDQAEILVDEGNGKFVGLRVDDAIGEPVSPESAL